ncbi:PAS domain S-box-containing protein [Desulfocicer vacuolatum DSM 3385]|uniref:PAS domain S-box-containing protein n=1 Tax=Desulfocicer vacuolatum DSM 3385 TaxID=1121400 RepID=A0A1W2AQ33_9BACT|nr:sigma 54-interacting transcriptional regulator [Desulfocicer vacuolatum]SMC62816.1 PAS domain S-box-containing protein [Desulfocicer vacuolatum DSM 3385]
MDIGKHWQTIIESVQDGVIIVDSGGNIMAANTTALLMTGYKKEEFLGKSCRILNCTGCKIVGKGPGKEWCGLFSRGLIRDKKCFISHKDHRSVQILKSATVFYDDNGDIVGAVETLKDVSDNIKFENELISLKKTYLLEDGFHGIVGKSPVMQSLFELIENVALTETPVMILGDSGTGKELVARAVHETGPRKDKPFIKVNCASLNESLLESELFGHVKGAYTGANRNRIGRFEAAHGGSIFLDEIGDIPMATQVKLLRVLEEKKIEKVGDNVSIDVDVRIITATNRNLEQLIQENVFREDLFFRINVFPIRCPSLVHRLDDIPLIAQHFINVNARKTGKNILGFTPEAMRQMMTYHWPGNVRELRNAVEYAFVLCNGSSVGPEHLPERVTVGPGPGKRSVRECREVLAESRADQAVDERKQLIQALKVAKGNQSRAARAIGVSRVTIWKRIKKYGIDLQRDLD